MRDAISDVNYSARAANLQYAFLCVKYGKVNDVSVPSGISSP